MKTLFQYKGTAPDGKQFEHKLEADDSITDTIVQSIATTTRILAMKAEADAKTAMTMTDLFRSAGQSLANIVAYFSQPDLHEDHAEGHVDSASSVPHEPTPEEAATKERLAAEAAEAAERAAYIPEPPKKTTLDGDLISYENSTDSLVQPGKIASIQIGERLPVAESGFPGLPETQIVYFGVSADFKPEAIRIPDGFALTGAFTGNQNMLYIVNGGRIPATALEEGKPQPDYPLAKKGCVITLQVLNTSDKQLAARVQVIGRALSKVETDKETT